ncbi:MAG: hypothetical protein ACXWE7_11340 [Nitrososphaeraceae archaeon]
MRNPSPPWNSLAVPKITSSSLLSKTWGFFMKITLVLLLKLLRVNAVTSTVKSLHAVTASGVTANG